MFAQAFLTWIAHVQINVLLYSMPTHGINDLLVVASDLVISREIFYDGSFIAGDPVRSIHVCSGLLIRLAIRGNCIYGRRLSVWGQRQYLLSDLSVCLIQTINEKMGNKDKKLMMILSIATLATGVTSWVRFKRETKTSTRRVKNINMAIGFIAFPALIVLLSYHAFMWMYHDLAGQYGEALSDWFFILAGTLMVTFWGILACIIFGAAAQIARDHQKQMTSRKIHAPR